MAAHSFNFAHGSFTLTTKALGISVQRIDVLVCLGNLVVDAAQAGDQTQQRGAMYLQLAFAIAEIVCSLVCFVLPCLSLVAGGGPIPSRRREDRAVRFARPVQRIKLG